MGYAANRRKELNLSKTTSYAETRRKELAQEEIKQKQEAAKQKAVSAVSHTNTTPMKPIETKHNRFTPEEIKNINKPVPNNNPVVGEKLFLTNTLPIHKKDNIVEKIGKGAVNVVSSVISAPSELARKSSIQGGSILTGNGIQKNLPKNTTFTDDILKPVLSKKTQDKVNEFEQKHRVISGIAKMGLDAAADPTSYIGVGAISKIANTTKSIEKLGTQQAKILNKINKPLDKLNDIKNASNTKSNINTLPDQTNVLKPNKPLTEGRKNILINIVNNPHQFPTDVVERAKNELNLQQFSEKPENIITKIASTGTKQNKFTSTALKSPLSNKEFASTIKKDMPTYKPITNQETLSKAEQFVNSDTVKAKDSFSSVGKGINADDVAVGEVLIKKAIKEGNYEEATKITTDLAQKLTEAGQTVQAASIIKRMTPEGMLMYAQRTVNNINRDLEKAMGKNFKKVEITKDEAKNILDGMAKVQKMADGRQKDVEMAKIMQLIANKDPSWFTDKLLGVQRISLLLNPKSMIRNVAGNVIFGTVDNLSNAVATPIDKLTGAFTKNRTTTLPSITGQLKSMGKGVKETLEDAKLGIDTSVGRSQYELPSKQIFGSKPMKALDTATKVGLQLGDRPFYQAAYDDVLRQQMKLNKVTEPTEAMIEQAHKIAQQRTYQDVNALTNAFKTAQKALNFGKPVGLGNVVLPFAKTPANILKRAIEYSPAGLEKTIKETYNIIKQNGKFDQKAFVDSIARATTGTGLIYMGYKLAKKGIITGSADKNKNVASFENAIGKNNYAFRFGNNYYTYDWAQPGSMALAIGADLFNSGKNDKQVENVIVEGIKSGGQTLFKQSLLQGVQRLFGGYNPMDNLQETLINAPSQFIPTASRQITQLTDKTQRNINANTSTDKGLNLIKSKIPGLSKTLEPKVNVFGDPVQNYQGKNNVGNVMLNPGFSTQYKPSKEQKEILRLYQSTGNNDVFPKVAPGSITYKNQSIKLTPKETTKFQTAMGKLTMSEISNIINSNDYSNLSDDIKSKRIKAKIEMAYDKAKNELLKDRGLK